MKKELTPEEKKKKRNTAIGAGIGMCFMILVTGLFNQNGISDKGLLKEVQKGNEQCPIVINEFMRVDSFSVPESKVFMQHVTAIGLVKEEANIDTIKKYIEPGLLQNVRTNSQLKSAREGKITFIYSFRDMNGEIFYECTITPDMYK